MYQYFKQIFNKSNKNLSNKSEQDKFQICFIVDQDNNIAIKMLINDVTVQSAKAFGDLLFQINEGYLAQSILDVMTDISHHSQDHYMCVKNMINTWSNKIIETERHSDTILDNNPIINPSQFGNSISK